MSNPSSNRLLNRASSSAVNTTLSDWFQPLSSPSLSPYSSLPSSLLSSSRTPGEIVDGLRTSGSNGYTPHFQNPLVILLGVIVCDQALESSPEKSNFVTTRHGFCCINSWHTLVQFIFRGRYSVAGIPELCEMVDKIGWHLALLHIQYCLVDNASYAHLNRRSGQADTACSTKWLTSQCLIRSWSIQLLGLRAYPVSGISHLEERHFQLH